MSNNPRWGLKFEGNANTINGGGSNNIRGSVSNTAGSYLEFRIKFLPDGANINQQLYRTGSSMEWTRHFGADQSVGCQFASGDRLIQLPENSAPYNEWVVLRIESTGPTRIFSSLKENGELLSGETETDRLVSLSSFGVQTFSSANFILDYIKTFDGISEYEEYRADYSDGEGLLLHSLSGHSALLNNSGWPVDNSQWHLLGELPIGNESRVGSGWAPNIRDFDFIPDFFNGIDPNVPNKAVCRGQALSTHYNTPTTAYDYPVIIEGAIPFTGNNKDELAFTDGSTINIQCQNTIIKWLHINNSNNSFSVTRFAGTNSGDSWFEECYIDRGTGTSIGAGGTPNKHRGWRKCVIDNAGITTIHTTGWGTQVTFDGNTLINYTETALTSTSGGGATFRRYMNNHAVENTGSDLNITQFAVYENNATADTSGQLTGYGKDEYVDFANDDYRIKSTSDLHPLNIGAFFEQGGTPPDFETFNITGATNFTIIPFGGLRTTYALQHSSNISFTESGTVYKTNTVNGESSFTVNSFGQVAKISPLVGETSFTLTSNGSITKVVSLYEQSSMTLTTDGAIYNTVSSNGNSNFTISSDGNTFVTQSNTGASTFTITTSGNINQSIAITGEEDFTIITFGTVDRIGGVDIDGESVFSITSGGAISVSYQLTEATNFTASTFGNTFTIKGVSESSNLTITTSGNINKYSSINGSSDYTLIINGSVQKTSSLYGETSSTINTSGNVNVFVGLTQNSHFSINAFGGVAIADAPEVAFLGGNLNLNIQSSGSLFVTHAVQEQSNFTITTNGFTYRTTDAYGHSSFTMTTDGSNYVTASFTGESVIKLSVSGQVFVEVGAETVTVGGELPISFTTSGSIGISHYIGQASMFLVATNGLLNTYRTIGGETVFAINTDGGVSVKGLINNTIRFEQSDIISRRVLPQLTVISRFIL